MKTISDAPARLLLENMLKLPVLDQHVLGYQLVNHEMEQLGNADLVQNEQIDQLVGPLQQQAMMPGVFLDILGMGVLITGDSGIGKSELALELVSRGHGLVADDVVELARTAPTTIEGRCPGMLRDYLEVRGLGLLNIRTIFGETASRRKMKLKLIVHLQKHTLGDLSQRLPFENQTQEILGVPIRKVVFQVAAGRNLAVLLEAAVRNCILQLRGIDSMGEFIARQQQAVLDSDS